MPPRTPRCRGDQTPRAFDGSWPGPPVRAEPEPHEQWTQRPFGRRLYFGLQGGQVNLVPDPLREQLHRPLTVVASSVKAPVHRRLDTAPDRLEQRERDEGRGRDGERLALGDTGEERPQAPDPAGEDGAQH